MVGVFAIVAFLAVIALIIWRVSSPGSSGQSKQSSSQGSQQSNQSSQPNTNVPSSPKTKTYKSTVGGYVFSYPEDWVLEASPGGSGETTTLKSPDLVTKEQAVGVYSVIQGAVITVSSYPCDSSCTISGLYKETYALATNRSETTVDDLPAARFTFGRDTQPQMYTIFFKNGYKYMATFNSSGSVISSPLLPIYTDIVVKSIRITTD